MAKVKPVTRANSDEIIGYSFYCPGCGHDHMYYTKEPGYPQWSFFGDVNKPTFTPSLLNRWGKEADPNWKEPEDLAPDKPGSWSGRCHLFVTNGQIQFCGDCSHHLNGQTVEMPEIKEVTA